MMSSKKAVYRPQRYPHALTPTKTINRRYLSIEDRIQIADLYREGHCPAYIARVMGQSRSGDHLGVAPKS
ncbi:helix-turn-helix domain-containing protein [Corynebacterium diphtheriae]|uniref:helix-turn-helix domain-containing protein n=2 Tax=Corynebacterium diphtheriae TaxID=1717 RepID=UPI0030C708EC